MATHRQHARHLARPAAEVCDIADRAVVLYNGTVFGVLGRDELTEEAIGFHAMGCPADEQAPA